MHGRSAIWFPLVLLALLAALTFWIQQLVQPPPPKRDGSSRHDPDYTVSNFVINKADRDGNPRSTLAAVSMAHFPDDDSTELIRPRYTQYSLRKPTMQVQGQRGHVSSAGDHIYMMDNVKAVREATPTKGTLTLLTDMLHIIPNEDVVLTDRPVRILQAPHTLVTGTGMELNNRERTFKLFHSVHVHYERPGAAAKNMTSLPPPPVAKAAPAAIAAKPPVSLPASRPAAAPAKSQVQQLSPATQKSAQKVVQKPVKKARRGKVKAEKNRPATDKPKTRIRRNYETSNR